ncbi:MAG: DUF1449 domain-containing protein [Cellvibrionaceae bacterium]
MFAIFLTEAMDPFYLNITSFPTVIFSFFLILCFMYGCLAVLGLADMDFLNFEIPEANLDVDAGDSLSNLNVLAGLLVRLGLNGVPVPVLISLISLIGWFICYYAVHFIFPFVPDGIIQFLAGIPIFIVSLYLSAIITSLIVKPLRPIFKSANQQVERNIVGQIAVVRTTRVDQQFGEATIEDGGAGLIVKVRSYDNEVFNRGDRVALLEYVKNEHVYRVVSESEFENKI